MSNCLRPPGFGSGTDSPPSRTDSNRIPSSVTDTMPPKTGACNQTPRGYRHLHPDELGKALGVPSEWTSRQDYSRKWVDGLTGIHAWEVCGRAVAEWLTSHRSESTLEQEVVHSPSPEPVSPPLFESADEGGVGSRPIYTATNPGIVPALNR